MILRLITPRASISLLPAFFAFLSLSAPPAAAESSAPRWARAAEWETSGGETRVIVREPWKGARKPLHYVIAADPDAPRGAIPASLRRIACLAAVHVGFLDALGMTDRIVAVDAASHIHHGGVRAAVAEGRVAQVGSGSRLNVERLLAARPDVVLANAVGASEHAALRRLERAGVSVLITAEWMENHPLARAEWVRLIGLLLGRADEADSVFAAVETAYRESGRRARARDHRPAVLLGGPFRDQWFVPGGGSFMARFLADAGAEYPWSGDTTAGGVPLSFETVLTRARAADLWLHPGDWRSLSEGASRDPRFAAFAAFRDGNVYNNDARRRADGANDYWESGAVRPDRVLADLIAIFHGDGDSLYYYRRLPP